MLVYTLKTAERTGQFSQPTIRPVKFWQVAVLVCVWVLIVIIGTVLASLFAYGWVVAAPFFLLGISLPILCLALDRRGRSARRVPPPAVVRLRLWHGREHGCGSVAGISGRRDGCVGIGVLAASNPELRTCHDQLRSQVANANAGDMQALLTVLAPYLTNPLIILSILVFAVCAHP